MARPAGAIYQADQQPCQKGLVQDHSGGFSFSSALTGGGGLGAEVARAGALGRPWLLRGTASDPSPELQYRVDRPSCQGDPEVEHLVGLLRIRHKPSFSLPCQSAPASRETCDSQPCAKSCTQPPELVWPNQFSTFDGTWCSVVETSET